LGASEDGDALVGQFGLDYVMGLLVLDVKTVAGVVRRRSQQQHSAGVRVVGHSQLESRQLRNYPEGFGPARFSLSLEHYYQKYKRLIIPIDVLTARFPPLTLLQSGAFTGRLADCLTPIGSNASAKEELGLGKQPKKWSLGLRSRRAWEADNQRVPIIHSCPTTTFP
jgi:hypothetical protein